MTTPSTPNRTATPPAENDLPVVLSAAHASSSVIQPNPPEPLPCIPTEDSASHILVKSAASGVDAGPVPPTSDRPRSASVESDDSTVKRKRSLTDSVPAGTSSEPPTKVAAVSSPSALYRMARAIINPFYNGANTTADSSLTQPSGLGSSIPPPMDVDQPGPAEVEDIVRRSTRKTTPVVPFSSTSATQRTSRQNPAPRQTRATSTAPSDNSVTRKGKQTTPQPTQEDVEMSGPTDQSRSNVAKGAASSKTPPGDSNGTKSRTKPTSSSAPLKRRIQTNASEDESEAATDTDRRTTSRAPKAKSIAPTQGGPHVNAAPSTQPGRRVGTSQRKNLQTIQEGNEASGPSGLKGKEREHHVDEGRRGSTINYDGQIREMTAHLQGALTGSIATGFRSLKADINDRFEQFDRRLLQVEDAIGSSHSKQKQQFAESEDGMDGDIDEDVQSQLLQAGVQKRQVEEHRAARKKTLKKQQQEAEKERKEDPQIAYLRRCVRDHVRTLLGIKEGLDPVTLVSPSPAAIAAVLDGTEEITAQKWQLVWTETKAHKFNRIALDVVVEDFITRVEEDSWYTGPQQLQQLPPNATDYDTVFEFADTFVEHLLRTHREEANKLIDARRQRSRRTQRKLYLCKTRRETLKQAPSARKHQPLMDLLGNQCASSDESDSTAGLRQKVFRRYVPAWRSNACGAFLGGLDEVRRKIDADLAALSGRQPRGSSPHIRMHTGIEHPSSSTPRGLPINCYHRPWYKSLTRGQRRQLGATAEIYDFSLDDNSDIEAREPDREDPSEPEQDEGEADDLYG